MSDLIATPNNPLEAIMNIVLDGLDSPNSKRSYESSLRFFFSWWNDGGRQPFNKSLVNRFKDHLRKSGLSTSAINLRLAAVRKLSVEAMENGYLDPAIASGISNIHDLKSRGTRAGNWLTKEEARALLDAPDTTTLQGLRDRAILAVLIGCGLRRAELASLTFEHIQMRESRWVIVDLIGKGAKRRSVPMPAWAKEAIDQWAQAANLTTGRVFRSIHKSGHVNGSMTPQAVLDVVNRYSLSCGLAVKPHDLRRTFAKLSYKGGAGLDQVSLSLGHASLQTTERYLGLAQSLTDAPCDHINLF
jgi:site-specific recombinase XerD